MKQILLILLLLPNLLFASATIHISATDTTICHGATDTFTAIATGVTTPHYKWMVNGTNTGITTFIFTTDSLHSGDSVVSVLTNAAGDTIIAHSNPLIITVQYPLSAGVITGPDSVCVGAAITLTDTVAGGAWQALNGNAGVVNGIVTGNSTDQFGPCSRYGIDLIYCIVSNICGADTASKSIIIHQTQLGGFEITSMSGTVTDHVCLPDEVQIMDGFGMCLGNVYTANNHASAIAWFIQSLSIGVDTIYNVTTSTCGNDTFSTVLNIIPAPTAGTIIVPTGELCVGATITLTDSTAIGAPQWSVNLVASIGQFNGILTANSSGIASVTALVPGCYFDTYLTTTAMISINPVPTPIIGYDSLCIGFTQLFFDSITGGTWSSSNSSVATIDSSSGITVGVDTGNTTIFYTLGTGCYDSINTTVILCENVTEITGNELTFFPNPVADELVINNNQSRLTKCIITNAVGQVFISQPINDMVTIINLKWLSPGIYFAKLGGANTQLMKRFVKE